MSAPSPLAERLNAEFSARDARLKAGEEVRRREADERARAIARFNGVCDQLRAHWEPRLAVFSEHFTNQLKVTPTMMPDQRQVQVVFLTELANMTMSLCASLSTDLKRVVIDYGLQIIPTFFEYERSSRLEVPLDPFDIAPIEEWVDDRLVACTRAYLSMQESRFYADRCTVEDPITKAKIIKSNAAAHLIHNGKVVYFASKQTMQDYMALQGIVDQAGRASDDSVR